MNARINKTIKKAKELLVLCPNGDLKDKMKKQITLIEIINSEDIPEEIMKEFAKETEAALETIEALYDQFMSN